MVDDVLLDTLADTLAGVEAETFCNTLVAMEAYTLVGTLPEYELKRRGGDTGVEIGKCGRHGIGRDVSLPNTGRYSKRCGGQDTGRHTG